MAGVPERESIRIHDEYALDTDVRKLGLYSRFI